MQEEQNRSVIIRLIHGRFGLALTYWLFGVVGAISWKLAFRFIQPDSTTSLMLIALMALYFGFIYVAIWRAADIYKGRKEWAFLAKAAVIVAGVMTFLPLLMAFFS